MERIKLKRELPTLGGGPVLPPGTEIVMVERQVKKPKWTSCRIRVDENQYLVYRADLERAQTESFLKVTTRAE